MGRSIHDVYSTSGIYFGAHAGVGYELALNDATALDLTAEYHWAHQDSDTATVAGDRFEFDSMNSHRTRLGLQVNRDFSERTTAYAGLAWEHEFDGKAKARVHGLRTPSPSLKGDTGVLEVGVSMLATESDALSLDVGLQGYTGRRQGVAGSARMEWRF